MDGHLRALTGIVGELHEPKFTDSYCTKQPQFAIERCSQQPLAISMPARTATIANSWPENIQGRRSQPNDCQQLQH
jgi:hypothetical protein